MMEVDLAELLGCAYMPLIEEGPTVELQGDDGELRGNVFH